MGFGGDADGCALAGDEDESARAVAPNWGRRWSAAALGTSLVLCSLVLLSMALYIRFAAATTTGMSFHGDCWQYLDAAGKWAQGDFEWLRKDKYYRPAIHLLDAAAVRLGGWNDVSIKFLNAVFDTLTIGLIAATLWRLRRGLLVCLAGSLLYSLPAFVVEKQVLQEYPHGASTAVVVCAVFLIVLGAQTTNWARYASLAGGGFLGGVAANMHADLALIGPGLVAFLLAYHLLARGSAAGLRRWVPDSAAVTLAFLIPHALGLAYFGGAEVFTVISNELTLPDRAGYRPDNISEFAAIRALRMPLLFFRQMAAGQWYWAVAFYLASAVAVYRGVRHRTDESVGLAAPMVVLVYCALFAALIGVLKPNMTRLMLPLFPLMLITCLYSFDAVLRPLIGRASGYLLLAASLCTLWLPSSFINQEFAPTRLRIWYQELAQRVGAEERLLVLPSTTCRGWAARWHGFLAHSIYLGDNAMYLAQAEFLPMPYRTETLNWAASVHDISYVLVTSGPYDVEKTLDYHACFHEIQGQGKYSVEAELDIIHGWLAETRAELVMERGGDQLYRLGPGRPVADSVMRQSSLAVWEFSKESGEGLPWRIPGAKFDERLLCVNTGHRIYVNFTGVLPSANDIRGIWIECFLEDTTTPASGPLTLGSGDLIALWAHADDYESGQFSYNLVRHTRFNRQGGEQSQFYYAEVSSRKDWRGQIDRLAIRAKPPAGAAVGRYRYCVRRIGLIGK